MVALKPGAEAPPKTTIAATIVEISLLTNDQKQLLRDFICGGDAFQLSEGKLQELAGLLGKSKLDLEAILRTLENFYEYLNEYDITDRLTPDEQRTRLTDSFKRLTPLVRYVDSVEDVADAILPLVKFDPSIELVRKRRRLKEGLIPNAVGFTSFVDLRPNFEREGPDIRAISEFVIQIQLFIHSDVAQPGSPPQIYQLDEMGLKELKDAIKLIDEKLSCLSKHNAGAPIR